MSVELIINASLPEIRIALLEDGEIQELLVERPSDRGVVGNIYKGRVTRVLPGMQAAFVDIGLEKAAFLYVDDVVVESEDSSDVDGVPGEDDSASDLDASGVFEDGSGEEEGEGPDEEDDSLEDFLETRDVEQPDLDSDENSSGEQDFSSAEASELESGSEDEEEGESSPLTQNDSEEDDDEDGGRPYEMAARPGSQDSPEDPDGDSDPEGTVSSVDSETAKGDSEDLNDNASEEDSSGEGAEASEETKKSSSPRGRGRRPSGRRRSPSGERGGDREYRKPNLPQVFHDEIHEDGAKVSDRSNLATKEGESAGMTMEARAREERSRGRGRRPEFRERRGRDKRIRSRRTTNWRARRPRHHIEDLLTEGQEVIVQVAKAPIAAKGARLTCHVSLPGRHLVCMPTIDHIGVSRRIERDDERRRLRQFVSENRDSSIGFIVRTASGGQDSEYWIKKDMDYLTKLWEEIRVKAETASAPAMIYEDLNSVLRAVRDWTSDEVRKIIVDSRYYYNDLQEFAQRFMPELSERIDLYQGDIPIFDAYGISTELHRSMERKVWLKSGGYIVIDQGEALTAIDVNTGRYVGQRNLEDTILKTNLEAVQEIAYQLRLRNCGGIVILDLIDMEKEENRQRVYRALEAALEQDRARPTIVQFTHLGLVEMTRKRTRDTLVRALCQTCNFCEGKGYVKSRQTVAYDVLREIERVGIDRSIKKVLVQAHPDVIEILAIDERSTISQLEKRYRKQIYLQAVMDFHSEQFEVSGDESAHTRHPSTRSRGRARATTQERGRRRRGGGSSSRRTRSDSRSRTDRSRSRSSSTYEERSRETSLNNQEAEVIGTEVGNTEGIGNQAQTASSAGEVDGNLVNPGVSSGDAKEASTKQPVTPQVSGRSDFEDEEDLLAFLRAQAAQDAALAEGTQSTTMQNYRQTPARHSTRATRSPNGAKKGGRRGRGGGRGGASSGGRSGRGGGAGRGRRSSGSGSGGRFRSKRSTRSGADPILPSS